MAEDKLTNCFHYKGYSRLETNAQGISLYYRVDQGRLYVISVLNAVSGEELTSQQYNHIQDQIKHNFQKWETDSEEYLGLIITHNPDKIKGLYADTREDTHWLIDLSGKRLLIFENQPPDFDGLREELELLLDEERRLLSEQLNHKVSMKEILSPINTGIVLLNVIAFLVLFYSPFLGGVENRMDAGGLSWYFVKEGQFYRFLTSMFMHADWSHLFNNMIVLLFIGDNLERAAGKLKFLFIYFGTGILAGITSISYNMWKDYGQLTDSLTISIGASGAIFGVVGAVLYIVIINRGRLEDISFRRMIVFAVLGLYGGFANVGIDNAAHIGGFLSGILLAALLYRRPKQERTK